MTEEKQKSKRPEDNTYVEEYIRVLRPLRGNHIFNETKYDKVVDTYDPDGIKLIVLREKKNV